MYGSKKRLHVLMWSLRRRLGLSPMQALMRRLRRRGIRLESMNGLEVYGGDGSRHTLDYFHCLKSLEAWELDPEFARQLQRNLPGARVLQVDSYAEIARTERTFDLAVLDNSVSLFGPEFCYCEHMEMFTPALLRVLNASAVLILNVVPDPGPKAKGSGNEPAEIHLRKRAEFYGVDEPGIIPVERMVESYRQKLQRAGFELEWFEALRRTQRSQVYYLALKVRRAGADAPEGASARSLAKEGSGSRGMLAALRREAGL